MNELNSSRFNALTGLRAIAAMMIFGFHLRKFWVAQLPDFLVRLLNEWQAGVSIFFVLSGFLIAYTYRDKPLGSKKQYIQYLLVRFARIFPIYLLLLTAKYAVSGFPAGKETFLNYTLLKGFSDKYNLTGIPQSWSLTVELTFYSLAPLVFMIGQRKKWLPFLFGSILFVLAVLTGFLLHKAGTNGDSWLYDYLFILNGTLFGRFVEFYIGILLAYRILSPAPPPSTRISSFPRYTLAGVGGILLAMFIVNCFAANAYSPGTASLGGLLTRNWLLPVFTASLIYGLITETTWIQKILASRIFMLLGNASYIFYLIHINFGYFTLAKVHLFPDYNFVFLWLTAIAAYLLVEHPLYQLAKKRIRSV